MINLSHNSKTRILLDPRTLFLSNQELIDYASISSESVVLNPISQKLTTSSVVTTYGTIKLGEVISSVTIDSHVFENS